MGNTFTLDRFEHANVVAALTFYAMHVAEPSECIRCLEQVAPDPPRPWFDIITEGRASWRAVQDTADANLPRYADEVAAMREP